MSRYSVVDESKKKSSLLQDNSWIKREVNEDKEADQNSNFGKNVLGRFKSNENLTSPTEKKTSTISSSSTGTDSGPPRTIQSMTKRYTAGRDEVDSSSTTATSTTYKDGTKTTVTTSRTSVVKPPIKTKTFSEKIFTDSKTSSEDIKTVKSVPPSSPTKTTKRESYTVTSYGDSTLQDGNKTVKTVTIPSSPTKTSRTETVTVTTFQDTIVKEDKKPVSSAPATSPSRIISDTTYTSTTPTSKTSSYSYSSKSRTDEQLFDTLIPTSIKETHASDTRNDKGSDTSSTAYTRRSYTDSRSEDYISDNVSTRYVKTVSSDRPEISFDTYKSSRSSMETLYTTPERKSYVEKDICTYCQKPIAYETKMLLEDADIKCHATCFKCDVCKSNLGHLKAGDSMWVYRRNVYCEACFYNMKDKWHR